MQIFQNFDSFLYISAFEAYIGIPGRFSNVKSHNFSYPLLY